MKPLCGLLLALLPTTAHAGLGDASSGAYVDASGGLGAAYGMPTGVGTEVGIGGWIGRYDDAFSIGRGWSFGARAHLDLGFEPEALDRRIATTFEFHRTIDLLVVGFRFGAQAGVVLRGPRGIPSCADTTTPCDLDTQAIGATVLGDAAIVYRFHRSWGLQLKGELGLDVGQLHPTVAPVGGVLLGLAFEAPVRHKASVAPPVEEAPVDPAWSEPMADPGPPASPVAPPVASPVAPPVPTPPAEPAPTL